MGIIVRLPEPCYNHSLMEEPIPISQTSSQHLINNIGRLTALLVALLALAAFGLSFEALRDLAIVAGGMNRGVAWLFPLLVDGGIVVFSLAALRASLTGSNQGWHLSLVVIVTVFSIALNIAHARAGWLASLMAAVPPLLLFFAFECLMRQLRDALSNVPKARKRISRAPAPVNLRLVSPTSQDRRGQVIEMSAAGASRSKIARELKMSPATVRRYLA